MQHSTVARRGAWPARFATAPARERERRLGLHPASGFVTAPARRTVLSRPEVGPMAALRAPWRTLTVAPSRRVRSGRPKPASSMLWTSSARGGGPRRPSVAPAWPA